MFAVTRHRFEELVADALDSLPPDLGSEMDNVAVLVEDRAEGRPLFGLYQGDAAYQPGTEQLRVGHARPHHPLPGRHLQCLFLGGGGRQAQIRKTVIHEVAHHFGISDPRLEELGWA